MNSLSAGWAVSCYVVFEELNRSATFLTFHIKDCIKAPFISVISITFSHFALHKYNHPDFSLHVNFIAF